MAQQTRRPLLPWKTARWYVSCTCCKLVAIETWYACKAIQLVSLTATLKGGYSKPYFLFASFDRIICFNLTVYLMPYLLLSTDVSGKILSYTFSFFLFKKPSMIHVWILYNKNVYITASSWISFPLHFVEKLDFQCDTHNFHCSPTLKIGL